MLEEVLDFTGSLRSSPLHVVLETPRKHRKLPFAWFFLRRRYPLYSTDLLMDSYFPACCTSTFLLRHRRRLFFFTNCTCIWGITFSSCLRIWDLNGRARDESRMEEFTGLILYTGEWKEGYPWDLFHHGLYFLIFRSLYERGSCLFFAPRPRVFLDWRNGKDIPVSSSSIFVL